MTFVLMATRRYSVSWFFFMKCVVSKLSRSSRRYSKWSCAVVVGGGRYVLARK